MTEDSERSRRLVLSRYKSLPSMTSGSKMSIKNASYAV